MMFILSIITIGNINSDEHQTLKSTQEKPTVIGTMMLTVRMVSRLETKP